MDFYACRWSAGMDPPAVAAAFDALNHHVPLPEGHFMPRIDLMPATVPPSMTMLFPVRGTDRLEVRIRTIRPDIHVYGHSHLNRDMVLDGITYVNNAFGYPREGAIARKELHRIHET